MTHTLHRLGDEDSLKRDFVILSMASRKKNLGGAQPKLQRVMEVLLRYDPVNVGEMNTPRGHPPEVLVEKITDYSIIHAVYDSRETVNRVLQDLKVADLGMSVVVTGIFDEVFDCCKGAGLSPNVVNMSLGIKGRTGLLPEQRVLEVTTMCGHAMVSRHLFNHLLEQVKNGKVTPEDAAEEMAKQCVCGIFNPKRAAELIRKAVDSDKM
ncbi:hypothetical protein ISS96_00015 [Candidatus Bathyarchaeota archaeon]|nr:hypothetical protein [Candidatus Bathyarchaeota archaeon]